MIVLKYTTIDYQIAESYFESFDIAYKWIKLQGPFIEWLMFDEDGAVYDGEVREDLKCL